MTSPPLSPPQQNHQTVRGHERCELKRKRGPRTEKEKQQEKEEEKLKLPHTHNKRRRTDHVGAHPEKNGCCGKTTRHPNNYINNKKITQLSKNNKHQFKLY